MLEFAFMRRALLVGFLLSVAIPCIGIVVVNRRSSMIGDALSHASLAGVALGLILSINPIVGAIIACVIAALAIDGIGARFQGKRDMATAIVMSAGIGLASILSDFVPGAAKFESFLFGSISAISPGELVVVLVVAVIVVAVFVLFYEPLLYLSFDESGAQLAGIPTKKLNFVFTLMMAVTIAIASRTVGVLMVSSLMVIPVSCGMILAKSYKQTVIWSLIFALCFTMGGITLSYYVRLKPGGSIVMLGVLTLCFLSLFPFKKRLTQ